MSQQEIASLFDKWNQELQTRGPKQVGALYAEDGILLPTVSNQVRHNPEEIADYFRPLSKPSHLTQNYEYPQSS